MADSKSKSKRKSKPRPAKGATGDGRAAKGTDRKADVPRPRRRRRRHLQPFAVIPLLFTLGNLIAGFAAIHYASKPLDFDAPFDWSSLTFAGALVFLGMFFDAVDGSVARLTRSETELGAQLDSLADVVTFGIAPAFMMLRLASHYVAAEEAPPILGPEAGSAFSKVLWGVAAAYVACTALRLARFNIETPSGSVDHHLVFRGLPSPGAGGCVASLIVLHQHYLVIRDVNIDEVTLTFARWTAFGMPVITLLCAIAMVSSIPYIHFVNRYLRGPQNFGFAGATVICLLLAAFWLQEAMAIGFTLFALSGPARLLANNLRRRRRRALQRQP